MKTNESLLVVVPLLEKCGNSIGILDTLDSIAEKASQVKRVAIYSDSYDYLQGLFKECEESQSFPGFPENVTTCVLGEGSDVSGIISIALEDFSDCNWTLILEPGDYLNEIPEILPDSCDYAILSYNVDVNNQISSQYLPNSESTGRHGIIIESDFLKYTEIYTKYEDPEFLSYLFLKSIENRVRVFTSTRNSLCGTREEELNHTPRYETFKYLEKLYTDIWEDILENDSNTEEVLEILRQWLWNTLNKFYVFTIFEKYPELCNNQEAIDFLIRSGMKDKFNK